MEKMKEKFAFFGGMSLLYGVIFTVFFYRSKMGINNILWVISVIVIGSFLLKKMGIEKKKGTNIYFLGMLLLSISSAWTASVFFYTYNTLGILMLYLMFMIHQFYDVKAMRSLSYIKGFLVIAGNFLIATGKPYVHAAAYFSDKTEGKKKKWVSGILGVLLGLGIMIIILPLLLKSDAVFSKVVGNLMKYINVWDGIKILFCILFGYHMCYAFFFSLCKRSDIYVRESSIKKWNSVVGMTSLFVVGIIYLLYVLIQIVYLFLGRDQLLPQGMTYSQYARGGFWELLVVSIINLFLVVIWSRFFERNRLLSILLTFISGCTFVMILSAGYRMILYIQAYHLTFLRIFVMWFLVVVAFIMAGVTMKVFREKFPLFLYTTAVVGSLYILLSLSKPEEIVVKYMLAQEAHPKQRDVYYLLSRPSLDGVEILSHLDYDSYDAYLKQYVYRYFTNISQKNQDMDIRSLNFSRHKAVKAVNQFLEKHSDWENILEKEMEGDIEY